MMKQMAATRYSREERFAFTIPSSLLLLEHLEHAVGHHKAAEDVDRGQCHRQEAHDGGEAEGRRAGGDDRADHDDAGNRVGHRHQRGVQRRRHLPDHVIADEDRQHEHGQAQHQRIDATMGGGTVNGEAGDFGLRLTRGIEAGIRRLDIGIGCGLKLVERAMAGDALNQTQARIIAKALTSPAAAAAYGWGTAEAQQ